MIIQACLNGARKASFHPALPTNADAIAGDAAAAIAAGASEIHVHVRGEGGRETLRPDTVDLTVERLRSACPGTPVGISTGAWIEKDDARRRDFIRNWSALPDYASVNLAEADCAAVIELLRKRGVGIEVGIATAIDAARCLELGFAAGALRLLYELAQQDQSEAFSELAAIERCMGAAAEKPILLHGVDATVWVFAKEAFARGYSTRVGLEDGATLPDGRIAPSNAALVAAAVALKNAAAKSGG